MIVQLHRVIGNQAVQRLLKQPNNGSKAQVQITSQNPTAHAVQRYVLQQATKVSGTQFQAQVRQPDGSFRGPNGVVIASGANATQLRVSEDGQMAIEDSDLSGRQPKVFYATNSVVKSSNKALKKAKSKYLLYVDSKKAITVTNLDGKQIKLHRILPKTRKRRNFFKRRKTNEKGMGLTVGQVCDEVAGAIVGGTLSLMMPRLKKALNINRTQLATHEYVVARYFVDRLQIGGSELTALTNVNTATFANRDTITQGYMNLLANSPGAASLIAEELGVNAFADPKVGQAFGSVSLGVPTPTGVPDYGQDPTGGTHRKPLTDAPLTHSGYTRDIWTTHYGAVVAESGGNKITLENYGRKHEEGQNIADDPIFYFQMYGPVTKPAQTWHGQWTSGTNPVINPITMVYG
jgi:hypothetical protein